MSFSESNEYYPPFVPPSTRSVTSPEATQPDSPLPAESDDPRATAYQPESHATHRQDDNHEGRERLDSPPSAAAPYSTPSEVTHVLSESDDPHTTAYTPENQLSASTQARVIEGLGCVSTANDEADKLASVRGASDSGPLPTFGHADLPATNTVRSDTSHVQDGKAEPSVSESLPFVTIPWHRDTILGSNPASIIVPDRQQNTDYSDVPDDRRLPVYADKETHWIPARLIKTTLAFNDDLGRGGDLLHDCTVFAMAATAKDANIKSIVNASFNTIYGKEVVGDVSDNVPLTLGEMEQRGLESPVGTVFVLSDNEDPNGLYGGGYHFIVKASDNPRSPLYVSKFGMNVAGFHELRAAAIYYKAKSMGNVTNLKSSKRDTSDRYL